MRQRLSRLRRAVKEKYPRTHKIIDKATDIVGWTPIIGMIYLQVLGLTYAYYKSERERADSYDK